MPRKPWFCQGIVRAKLLASPATSSFFLRLRLSFLVHHVTVHFTSSRIGICALREPPQQNEDNSNPRELFDSRLTACHNPQNKASARALCSPYSTAKAGSIATAHRLKHAWLASHHRAPSSQQSKSSINSVTVAIKHQVAIHLQIAVVARFVVLQKQSARPSRARFATGLAGWDQYWRLESCVGFFGAAC